MSRVGIELKAHGRAGFRKHPANLNFFACYSRFDIEITRAFINLRGGYRLWRERSADIDRQSVARVSLATRISRDRDRHLSASIRFHSRCLIVSQVLQFLVGSKPGFNSQSPSRSRILIEADEEVRSP